MSKAKQQPILIVGFQCRLDTIREEAVATIMNAVAEHKVIGTFYRNLGEHYRLDNEGKEYDSSPAVVTHNDSFGTYGGYKAATVYELFFDKQSRLRCTLNGEAGENFDEPIEHIQTEGLLRIVEWLVEYGFVADDPWRCETCGSLAVQANVWIDANTHGVIVSAQNRSEHYCRDCCANVYLVRQSELLRNIRRWFDTAPAHALAYLSGYRPEDYADEALFRRACLEYWETLSIKKKIAAWDESK